MSAFWDGFFNLFQTGRYLQVLLFIAALVVMKSLWNLQKDRSIQINFVDLLIGSDGKASGSKMMQLGAFAISTWAFVYLVIKNNLSEWYYTTYMLSWSGSHLISKWLSDKATASASESKREDVKVALEATDDDGNVKIPAAYLLEDKDKP